MSQEQVKDSNLTMSHRVRRRPTDTCSVCLAPGALSSCYYTVSYFGLQYPHRHLPTPEHLNVSIAAAPPTGDFQLISSCPEPTPRARCRPRSASSIDHVRHPLLLSTCSEENKVPYCIKNNPPSRRTAETAAPNPVRRATRSSQRAALEIPATRRRVQVRKFTGDSRRQRRGLRSTMAIRHLLLELRSSERAYCATYLRRAEYLSVGRRRVTRGGSI
ncbi:hypothetical protein BV20DRAFT_34599 [Pilatotrama ljubarskyi]|nr:hypothetical protein BV20DRAFT_34599 [Pilatotrama ljubarskyi]